MSRPEKYEEMSRKERISHSDKIATDKLQQELTKPQKKKKKRKLKIPQTEVKESWKRLRYKG